MKTPVSLLFYLTLLSACTKVDSSSGNAPCSDSCTTVQGRFITGNNEGVANTFYEISYGSRPTFGVGLKKIRTIATGKTDANGFYSASFAFQKGEFEATGNSNVLISFNYDKTRFVPVTWYETFGANETLGPFTRRDTTLTANIYFTSRSKLKVRLENFVPMRAGDDFSVITPCGAGLDRHYSTGGYINATQSITEGEIDACGNEQTTVIVRKHKNGVATSESTTIATPTGKTVAVTFSY